jgi:D-arabinose 1-dehydrogenase-like Zn-dependent alcohol dehydrogenase
MLDFCAEHGVVADTETIPMQEIETAFARMAKERHQVSLRRGHEVAEA